MEGVKANPSKIQSILEWPIPKSIKTLRGFLGLMWYYQNFIKNYDIIVTPLIIFFLKKNAFELSDKATQALEELKKVVTHPPILKLLDFIGSFTIIYDASERGIGVVLRQSGDP